MEEVVGNASSLPPFSVHFVNMSKFDLVIVPQYVERDPQTNQTKVIRNVFVSGIFLAEYRSKDDVDIEHKIDGVVEKNGKKPQSPCSRDCLLESPEFAENMWQACVYVRVPEHRIGKGGVMTYADSRNSYLKEDGTRKDKYFILSWDSRNRLIVYFPKIWGAWRPVFVKVYQTEATKLTAEFSNYIPYSVVYANILEKMGRVKITLTLALRSCADRLAKTNDNTSPYNYLIPLDDHRLQGVRYSTFFSRQQVITDRKEGSKSSNAVMVFPSPRKLWVIMAHIYGAPSGNHVLRFYILRDKLHYRQERGASQGLSIKCEKVKDSEGHFSLLFGI